jgi:AAA+ superfamily predicted ATPase
MSLLPRETVNASLLESVLRSRIDQAIAITPPSDQTRVELLEAIHQMDALPAQFASFPTV